MMNAAVLLGFSSILIVLGPLSHPVASRRATCNSHKDCNLFTFIIKNKISFFCHTLSEDKYTERLKSAFWDPFYGHLFAW